VIRALDDASSARNAMGITLRACECDTCTCWPHYADVTARRPAESAISVYYQCFVTAAAVV